jgi:WD40 repeat protein
METIIPETETIDYLRQMKLTNIFPESINSLTNKEKKSENNIININSEVNFPQNNNIQSYKLEKNLKGKIKLNTKQLTSNNLAIEININYICSYNNILFIANNNELYLYDISDNYELYGKIKTPGEDKNILCLACTEFNDVLYCVMGGEFSSIHVIDVLAVQELTGYQLIGHKNKVYQLEFHPYNKNLLLSASKDCTVRLWNFKIPELLVIFGGPNSFESDVLCIDWDNKGEYFVGSGVDCVVRIYKIDKLIQDCINMSMDMNSNKNKGKTKTLLKSLPYFSCNDIHDNLIDCIKYNNKFIISKSVDGVIKEWLPFKDINGQNSFFLINIFVFNTKQLILGIKFCFVDNNIVVGNEMGEIFLFNKEKSETSKEVCEHNFFQNNYTQKIKIENNILLKNVHFNSFYNLIFFGGNTDEIYIYHLSKVINKENK